MIILHTKKGLYVQSFFYSSIDFEHRSFRRDHSVRSAMTGSFLDADLDGISPPIMVRTVAMMTRATAA